MRTLRQLTISSIKMFMRNKQAMIFTFMSPLIIMGIFGLIGFDRTQKIDIGLAVNAPPTVGTAALVEQIKNVPLFDVTIGTEADERKAIEDGDRAAVILVPFDLVADTKTTEPKSMTVLTNIGQAQQAGTAVTILTQMLDKMTINMSGATELFKIDRQEINTKDLSYIDFLIPGVVAMSLMQMAVFSVAFVFVDYKEKGVLKRLLATPLKPWQFVSANVITRLIVAVIQAAILIAVGVIFFDTQVVGSYWLILLTVMLGAIMFLGLGFTISGFAKTVESVPAAANLIVFPMLFLGGTFFPIETMPTWLQGFAKFLPLTYLSSSLRAVMTEGAGLAEITPDLLWMLVWSIVLVFCANLVFGFEEKRM